MEDFLKIAVFGDEEKLSKVIKLMHDRKINVCRGFGIISNIGDNFEIECESEDLDVERLIKDLKKYDSIIINHNRSMNSELFEEYSKKIEKRELEKKEKIQKGTGKKKWFDKFKKSMAESAELDKKGIQ